MKLKTINYLTYKKKFNKMKNQNKEFEVFVKYCCAKDSQVKFGNLKTEIEKNFNKAIVEGKEALGETGEFEILVDGNLLYSRKSSECFPEIENVIKDIDEKV